MSRKKKNADNAQRERYFSKIAEKAENAMREYQQERGGEHFLFAAEYIRLRSYLLEQ